VPGNVGATAGGGEVDVDGVSVPDVVDEGVVLLLLVPLSVGRPMSVVDTCTVV
jgi:hypothetical protein